MLLLYDERKKSDMGHTVLPVCTRSCVQYCTVVCTINRTVHTHTHTLEGWTQYQHQHTSKYFQCVVPLPIWIWGIIANKLESLLYYLPVFLCTYECNDVCICSYCYCYYDYKNMTTFLPNPLSSIFLSFGKRRQAWPRSSKCHRLTSYSFVRSSFVWKSFRKRSATLQSFPVDTIQADQIANTSFAQCESNNKSNNTHHFSIQSFIEIPSYHPWEPGSSHTELTSLEITDIYIPATPPLQIALFPHSILWTYTIFPSKCHRLTCYSFVRLKIGGYNIQRINIIKLKNNHCRLRREIEVYCTLTA